MDEVRDAIGRARYTTAETLLIGVKYSRTDPEFRGYIDGVIIPLVDNEPWKALERLDQVYGKYCSPCPDE